VGCSSACFLGDLAKSLLENGVDTSAMLNNGHIIPVIDLFAGPGGLGEGFSRYPNKCEKRFKIELSIEKDLNAHKTLNLRAFFRQFKEDCAPDEYYQYLRGEIPKDALFALYPKQAFAAADEARLLTLGKQNPDALIRKKLLGKDHWILIGGPPCQAYSLVGRSKILGGFKRESGETEEAFNRRRLASFDKDDRHQLYREYLAIIAKLWPSIFVMENVRGILSAKHNGERIFPKILKDLSNPAGVFPGTRRRHKYRIYSLTVPSHGDPFEQDPSDFIIHSEYYGIPQARHRVILLGIRDDLDCGEISLLEPCEQKTVEETISDLPKLTPGVTKLNGTRPYDALAELLEVSLYRGGDGDLVDFEIIHHLKRTIEKARRRESRGSRYMATDRSLDDWWYRDPRLNGVCNHETRSHIKQDLWRYAFAACYAEQTGFSPQLREFPKALLPKHANVKEAISGQKFGDRFRVQVASRPSTTITSHISKDGHYFIHYDPKQYRSLTVREAARLQTFPDNYFFEGTRTSQYHQVGNAVPPLLAYKVAGIVSKLIETIT
jgi:DNA (cytosine-5)-methyltransferase 1